MDSYKDIWNLVLGQLSKKYSDAAMELWFNNSAKLTYYFFFANSITSMVFSWMAA